MSFRLKTIIGVASIEAVLLAALVWHSIEILTGSVEEGLTKRAVTTSQLFADAAKDATISSDLATLEALVTELIRSADLRYVRVIGAGDTVLAQAGASNNAPFQADTSYRSVDDGVYDVMAEIAESGTQFGKVEIGFSIAPLTATVETARRNMITIALVEMILVALFSFVLGIYLTRQLRQLATASDKVAAGDFGYQLEVTGKDELAETASAFNIMSRRVSDLYEQVAENERRSRTIVNASLDAIIGIDQHGRIVEFNPAAEAMFGYSREEVIGATLANLIIPEHMREAHNKGLAHYLATGKGPVIGERLELPALRSNGDEFPAEVSIQAETGAEGPIYISYIRDVTEQKQAERDLREAKENAETASAVKSEFLAMMSHEIRTPINGVIGTLNLLEDTSLDDQQKELAQTGRRSGEALLGIINDILDFSKMEAGKFSFDIAPFRIADIVETVEVVVSPRADAKGIQIASAVADAVPEYLLGDEGRVRQVLLNLVGNAVKFTDQGSVTTRVSLDSEDSSQATVRFDVVDTGIGISTEHQDDLFQEFTTLTPSYTQKFGGTGLGLAISKTLVDNMKGEIGFESQVGTGSRFWFTIPFGKPSEHTIEAVATEARVNETISNVAMSGSILLAEDNPANQLVTRGMLEKAGLSVDVVGNGLEAMAAIKQRPYHLILMDIGMPELDGVGAMQQIRKLPSDRAQTPIIAMTAHVMKGDRSKLLAQGMDDYLPKPTSRERLLTCIANWLDVDVDVDVHASPGDAPAKVSASPIDTSALRQLGEDTDPSLVPQLIETFLETAEQQMESIVSAAASSNIEQITQTAHALKSSSATFGAHRMNELVKSLESAGKLEDTATLADMVPHLEREAAAVFQALREYRDQEAD